MPNEYRCEVNKVFDYDVVVCGSGFAGFSAAVAAARAGAKTIMLERDSLIGGQATAGLVNPCMISFDGKGERQIVKGIFDELFWRLDEKGYAVHPSKTGDGSPHGCYYMGYNRRHNNTAPFEPHMIQLEMMNMPDEAGAEYLVRMAVLDVIMKDNKVTGVVVFDGSAVRQYNAKVVIDCTGDGLVSLKAGTISPECAEGSGYEVQPMSIGFSVYDVDDEAVDRYIEQHPEERGNVYRAIIEEDMEKMGDAYIVPRNKLGLHRYPQTGAWNMNCTRLQGLNNTVPEEYIKAYKLGLEQVFFLMDYMHKLPGLENAKLKEVSPAVGVRESRRIEGVYTLQAEDLIDPPKYFDDSIAMGSFLLDLHPASGTRAGIDTRPIVANCFQIPYRILVPKSVDGLLVAGRCVSGSRDAMSSIRVMPQASAMGQAAGEAAAMCVENGTQPRNVDVKALQERLVKNGAVIE